MGNRVGLTLTISPPTSPSPQLTSPPTSPPSSPYSPGDQSNTPDGYYVPHGGPASIAGTDPSRTLSNGGSTAKLLLIRQNGVVRGESSDVINDVIRDNIINAGSVSEPEVIVRSGEEQPSETEDILEGGACAMVAAPPPEQLPRVGNGLKPTSASRDEVQTVTRDWARDEPPFSSIETIDEGRDADVEDERQSQEELLGSGGWRNRALDIARDKLGAEQLQKRISKLTTIPSPGFGSRARLTLQTNKAKKTVGSPTSHISRSNCVGAVGYAVVIADSRLPDNDFFRPDIRFRVRLRHSNLRCSDDAASCQREAAIKFADQNEDGPLDLILLTGRTALARNCDNLMDIMRRQKPEELCEECERDPLFYFALVDGLRRAPSSYADLIYHSQIAYMFIPRDGRARMVKFRLVPGDALHRQRQKTSSNHAEATHAASSTGSSTGGDAPATIPESRSAGELSCTCVTPPPRIAQTATRVSGEDLAAYVPDHTSDSGTHSASTTTMTMGHGGFVESGLLDEAEQEHPWLIGRGRAEKRPRYYLRNEFMRRMEGFDAIRYVLQIQISQSVDDSMWNPQLIWNEVDHPWIDLLHIQLTTIIPLTALCRTYFNIVDKPPCLRFVSPPSVYDFRSYQYACAGMYTRFEIDHMQVAAWKGDELLQKEFARRGKIQHYVSICTAAVRDTKPRVDVFITLIGTRGRTAPQLLDHRLEEDDEALPPASETMEHFLIQTEPVGELLAVSIAVRHRHLTDEWYLRYVVLSDPERLRVRHFPCHNVVLSKTTLRPGEVSLPQKDCHELLRQERLLELRDRQSDYLWTTSLSAESLPSHIDAQTTRDLPVNEQMEGSKFTGMPWDVDPTTIETLLPFLVNAAARGLLPSIPLFHRQTASMGDNLPAMGPVRRGPTNAGGATGPARNTPEASGPARRRWRKIRFAIAFISKAKLPDGPKGEMCRSVEDDVDFGRFYLMGHHPVMLRRLNGIPDNLPVTDETFEGYLNRGRDLAGEIEAGHVYIADYRILQNIPCIHRDADHRHLVAPIVLFFVREFGDLIPLCIQLGQDPGPDNPIWTPRDNPEDWILAKLWVRSSDYHYHFAITHLLKSHFMVEPFAISTMRQLSSSHPVYKLLKPHFRYTLVTNTLLRRHILRRNCALDKYTSIGSNGFRRLMERYLDEQFTFDELNLERDLASRAVDDAELLPNYFYRDDGLRLWSCIQTYCTDLLRIFYADNDDVATDTELQAWITEINQVGFACLKDEARQGLPSRLTTVDDLATLTTTIIFTSTCLHSATHTEALDLYGFIPGIPAMMRQPPMTVKKKTNKEVIIKTLPDQFPDAYYGSLATLLQVHRPDENTLGDSSETYFVEPAARRVTDSFKIQLDAINRLTRSRNKATSIVYENLVPTWIPNSVEPLPFLPKVAKEEAMKGAPTSDTSTSGHVFMMTPSVPLSILPMCMFLARSMGTGGGLRGQGKGGGGVGKGGGAGGFSHGMDGVGVPRDERGGKGMSMPKQKFSEMF